MTNEELVILIQQGDKERIAELYQQNTGIIEKIAHSFTAYEEKEDLMQVAFFGLVRAVELWKPDAGTLFISYATYWIKQSMFRHIEENGSILRLSSHRRERIRLYKRFIADFMRDVGRKPTAHEICVALELDPGQVETIRADANALTVKSLQAEIDADGDAQTTLADMIPDEKDSIADATEKIYNKELATVLWGLVAALGEQEEAVLKKIYIDNLQYGQIAEQIGAKSAGKVRDIKQRALNKLRRGNNLKALKSFYDECAVLSYQATSRGYFMHTNTSSPERAILILEQRGHHGKNH